MESKKLEDLCQFINGLWKGKKPPYIEVGVIRNTNFKADGSLDDSDIAYLEVEEKQFKTRQLQYKDIILEKSGGGPKQPVGRVVLFDKEEGLFSLSNFTSAIRVINQHVLLPEFLHKYLYHIYQSGITEEMQSHSTGIRNLNFNSYKSIEIPLPSLEEQRRIVAVLDDAFVAIAQARANAQRNHANARELFDTTLNHIFSNPAEDWEKKTLQQISKDYGRGKSKHRPRNDSKLYGGEYPFIQTGDIRNSLHFIHSYTQTYNEMGLAQSKLWPAGTVCITIAANIAETGILTFDSCFPDSIIGIVVDEKLSINEYVEYLLRFEKLRIQSKGQGSAQDNINMATFENEYFSFPPLEKQIEHVNLLNSLQNEIGDLQTIYQQKISALDELKQALLHQAFTGQLATQTLAKTLHNTMEAAGV